MMASIPSSTLEKFSTFGDLLRFLRRRAGLTQLELSIAVGYSDAQISRLEQNLRPPDLPTIEARFVQALGLEHEPEAVARLLDLAAHVRREDAPSFGVCPYKGLNYFDEGDADLFVGREALTAGLQARLVGLTAGGDQGQRRFLAIVGASGSGKSSLARAGLVPALRWNKSSADWRIHVLTPTARPLKSLAISLTDSAALAAQLVDNLASDPRSLGLLAAREARLRRYPRLLLVIDQFEELFTLCRSEGERAAFINNLLTAASESDGPVAVIITLRADFYAHCAGYPQLREALAGQQEYIGAMSDAELRRAIEEPARRGNWELEPGLVDLLLHDVGHEPGALPLLSHALLETWQRRRGHTMTLSGYASSGGVRGAIAETAEAVFTDQFSHDQQAIARRIFLRLTELGDETSTGDTRRRATFAELVLKPEETDTTRAVLSALADARLITLSEESAEVAHEALIREWPTLRGWLEDNREGLRLHRQLTEAAQEWARVGRDPDLLYRGARLAQAGEWAAANTDELNVLEQEFLGASTESAQREAAEQEAQRQRELEAAQRLAETEQRRAEAERQRAEERAHAAAHLRRRAYLLGGASAIAVLLAGLALFLGNSANRNAASAHASALTAQQSAAQAQQNASAAQSAQATAEAERLRAEGEDKLATSRELALAANSNLNVDPELSVLLALRALSLARTPEAESALHSAVQADRPHLTLQHDSAVVDVTYSPDGTRLATTSGDGAVKIWEAVTGRELLSFSAPGAVGIQFSPDGARLGIAYDDNKAGIWDAATGRQLLTLADHTGWVQAVDFSPDGTRLATASEDHTAKVWDLTTGQVMRTFHQSDIVSTALFSPDGKRLLTSSWDLTSKVWDLATGQEVMTLPGINAQYSPDGRRIVAGYKNGSTIWDAATGQVLSTLPDLIGGAGPFTPDGTRTIEIGSFNGGPGGTVGIWDMATGKVLFTFPAHTRNINNVAVSPDGIHFATASDDGMVKIWDLSPQTSREWLTLSPTDAGSAAYSPDGRRLATSGPDNTAIIWDAETGQQLVSLSGNSNKELVGPGGYPCGIGSVAFSPDGSRLATGSCDGTASLWDAATGKELLRLRKAGHGEGVIGAVFTGIMAVAFSPDGKLLATAGADGTAVLWDASSGMPLLTLDNHGIGIANLAFSPDGNRLVTAGGDAASGTDVINRVWDVGTGKELFSIAPTKASRVFGLAFSPDGKRLATGDFGGIVKIWDAQNGQELLSLPGQPSYILSLAFSPDGSRLASASGDGIIKLWDASSGEQLLALHGYSTLFSPDGTRLAAAGEDNTVDVYLLRLDDLIALAKSRLTRTLTTEECQKYLHVNACPPGP